MCSPGGLSLKSAHLLKQDPVTRPAIAKRCLMPNTMAFCGVLCLFPSGTSLLKSVITYLHLYGKLTLHLWLCEFMLSVYTWGYLRFGKETKTTSLFKCTFLNWFHRQCTWRLKCCELSLRKSNSIPYTHTLQNTLLESWIDHTVVSFMYFLLQWFSVFCVLSCLSQSDSG